MMNTLSYRLGTFLCNVSLSLQDLVQWKWVRPVLAGVANLGRYLQCRCDDTPLLDELIRLNNKGKQTLTGNKPFRFYITHKHKLTGTVSEMSADKLQRLLDHTYKTNLP